MTQHVAGASLECRDLSVAYGHADVVFGVDIEVQGNEIVALLGTNGAGKSTVLRAISGLTDVVGGEVLLDGRDITALGAAGTAALGVTHVPGGRATFPELTVAEHFTAASWLEGPDDTAPRLEHVLEQFPQLRRRWTEPAGLLSGGEQQQLALGMAFAMRPRLLMIDELSLGLAPAVVVELLKMIEAIRAEGCTVLLVEQSVEVAARIASRAYFMEKGQVRFAGSTAELLDRDDLLRAVLLKKTGGRGKPRQRRTKASLGGVTGDRETVLEVRGLRRAFGGVTAVDDVDLRLLDRQILGIIGPNGAGKTTVFDLVSGHLPADDGQIRLNGADIASWPAHRRALAGLGRSFQDARLFPSLTVRETVALGFDRHIEIRSHLASLLNLPAAMSSEKALAAAVDEVIDLLHLGAHGDALISELSTGLRRAVEIAVVLAQEPAVVLLDEPSSGLAEREVEALVPLLFDVREQTGCAMLLIEHDMNLVSALCDEVVALDLGRVIAQGPTRDVLRDRAVLEAYLGLPSSVRRRRPAARS